MLFNPIITTEKRLSGELIHLRIYVIGVLPSNDMTDLSSHSAKHILYLISDVDINK